jgi:hypothetical protein
MMGLGLVAVLTLCAMGAGSASALPEVGRCVAKAGGPYKDAGCTEKAGKLAGEKKFAFEKGAVKKGFAGIGGAVAFETPAGNKVECKTETATGEYKEVSKAIKEVTNVVWKLSGCELLGQACTSKGQTFGVIAFNPMGGKLGYISGKGSKAPVVGQELHPLLKKGAFAEFSCASVLITYKEGPSKGGDCVIAPVTPVNAMTETLSESYSASAKGQQSPQSFEGSKTICNIEVTTNVSPPERVSVAMVTSLSNEEPLEIKA